MATEHRQKSFAPSTHSQPIFHQVHSSQLYARPTKENPEESFSTRHNIVDPFNFFDPTILTPTSPSYQSIPSSTSYQDQSVLLPQALPTGLSHAGFDRQCDSSTSFSLLYTPFQSPKYPPPNINSTDHIKKDLRTLTTPNSPLHSTQLSHCSSPTNSNDCFKENNNILRYLTPSGKAMLDKINPHSRSQFCHALLRATLFALESQYPMILKFGQTHLQFPKQRPHFQVLTPLRPDTLTPSQFFRLAQISRQTPYTIYPRPIIFDFQLLDPIYTQGVAAQLHYVLAKATETTSSYFQVTYGGDYSPKSSQQSAATSFTNESRNTTPTNHNSQVNTLFTPENAPAAAAASTASAAQSKKNKKPRLNQTEDQPHETPQSSTRTLSCTNNITTMNDDSTINSPLPNPQQHKQSKNTNLSNLSSALHHQTTPKKVSDSFGQISSKSTSQDITATTTTPAAMMMTDTLSDNRPGIWFAIPSKQIVSELYRTLFLSNVNELENIIPPKHATTTRFVDPTLACHTIDSHRVCLTLSSSNFLRQFYGEKKFTQMMKMIGLPAPTPNEPYYCPGRSFGPTIWSLINDPISPPQAVAVNKLCCTTTPTTWGYHHPLHPHLEFTHFYHDKALVNSLRISTVTQSIQNQYEVPIPARSQSIINQYTNTQATPTSTPSSSVNALSTHQRPSMRTSSAVTINTQSFSTNSNNHLSPPTTTGTAIPIAIPASTALCETPQPNHFTQRIQSSFNAQYSGNKSQSGNFSHIPTHHETPDFHLQSPHTKTHHSPLHPYHSPINDLNPFLHPNHCTPLYPSSLSNPSRLPRGAINLDPHLSNPLWFNQQLTRHNDFTFNYLFLPTSSYNPQMGAYYNLTIPTGINNLNIPSVLPLKQQLSKSIPVTFSDLVELPFIRSAQLSTHYDSIQRILSFVPNVDSLSFQDEARSTTKSTSTSFPVDSSLVSAPHSSFVSSATFFSDLPMLTASITPTPLSSKTNLPTNPLFSSLLPLYSRLFGDPDLCSNRPLSSSDGEFITSSLSSENSITSPTPNDSTPILTTTSMALPTDSLTSPTLILPLFQSQALIPFNQHCFKNVCGFGYSVDNIIQSSPLQPNNSKHRPRSSTELSSYYTSSSNQYRAYFDYSLFSKFNYPRQPNDPLLDDATFSSIFTSCTTFSREIPYQHEFHVNSANNSLSQSHQSPHSSSLLPPPLPQFPQTLQNLEISRDGSEHLSRRRFGHYPDHGQQQVQLPISQTPTSHSLMPSQFFHQNQKDPLPPPPPPPPLSFPSSTNSSNSSNISNRPSQNCSRDSILGFGTLTITPATIHPTTTAITTTTQFSPHSEEQIIQDNLTKLHTLNSAHSTHLKRLETTRTITSGKRTAERKASFSQCSNIATKNLFGDSDTSTPPFRANAQPFRTPSTFPDRLNQRNQSVQDPVDSLNFGPVSDSLSTPGINSSIVNTVLADLNFDTVDVMHTPAPLANPRNGNRFLSNEETHSLQFDEDDKCATPDMLSSPHAISQLNSFLHSSSFSIPDPQLTFGETPNNADLPWFYPISNQLLSQYSSISTQHDLLFCPATRQGLSPLLFQLNSPIITTQQQALAVHSYQSCPISNLPYNDFIPSSYVIPPPFHSPVDPHRLEPIDIATLSYKQTFSPWRMINTAEKRNCANRMYTLPSDVYYSSHLPHSYPFDLLSDYHPPVMSTISLLPAPINATEHKTSITLQREQKKIPTPYQPLATPALRSERYLPYIGGCFALPLVKPHSIEYFMIPPVVLKVLKKHCSRFDPIALPRTIPRTLSPKTFYLRLAACFSPPSSPKSLMNIHNSDLSPLPIAQSASINSPPLAIHPLPNTDASSPNFSPLSSTKTKCRSNELRGVPHVSSSLCDMTSFDLHDIRTVQNYLHQQFLKSHNLQPLSDDHSEPYHLPPLTIAGFIPELTQRPELLHDSTFVNPNSDEKFSRYNDFNNPSFLDDQFMPVDKLGFYTHFQTLMKNIHLPPLTKPEQFFDEELCHSYIAASGPSSADNQAKFVQSLYEQKVPIVVVLSQPGDVKHYNCTSTSIPTENVPGTPPFWFPQAGHVFDFPNVAIGCQKSADFGSFTIYDCDIIKNQSITVPQTSSERDQCQGFDQHINAMKQQCASFSSFSSTNTEHLLGRSRYDDKPSNNASFDMKAFTASNQVGMNDDIVSINPTALHPAQVDPIYGKTDSLLEPPHRCFVIHFSAWSDAKSPDLDLFIRFFIHYRQLKQAINLRNSPPVIHCLAGVGRTGTFIAIDILWDLIEGISQRIVEYWMLSEQFRQVPFQIPLKLAICTAFGPYLLNDLVPYVLCSLRVCRKALVQNQSQYRFIFLAVDGLFDLLMRGADYTSVREYRDNVVRFLREIGTLQAPQQEIKFIHRALRLDHHKAAIIHPGKSSDADTPTNSSITSTNSDSTKPTKSSRRTQQQPGSTIREKVGPQFSRGFFTTGLSLTDLYYSNGSILFPHHIEPPSSAELSIERAQYSIYQNQPIQSLDSDSAGSSDFRFSYLNFSTQLQETPLSQSLRNNGKNENHHTMSSSVLPPPPSLHSSTEISSYIPQNLDFSNSRSARIRDDENQDGETAGYTFSSTTFSSRILPSDHRSNNDNITNLQKSSGDYEVICNVLSLPHSHYSNQELDESRQNTTKAWANVQRFDRKHFELFPTPPQDIHLEGDQLQLFSSTTFSQLRGQFYTYNTHPIFFTCPNFAVNYNTLNPSPLVNQFPPRRSYEWAPGETLGIPPPLTTALSHEDIDDVIATPFLQSIPTEFHQVLSLPQHATGVTNSLSALPTSLTNQSTSDIGVHPLSKSKFKFFTPSKHLQYTYNARTYSSIVASRALHAGTSPQGLHGKIYPYQHFPERLHTNRHNCSNFLRILPKHHSSLQYSRQPSHSSQQQPHLSQLHQQPFQQHQQPFHPFQPPQHSILFDNFNPFLSENGFFGSDRSRAATPPSSQTHATSNQNNDFEAPSESGFSLGFEPIPDHNNAELSNIFSMRDDFNSLSFNRFSEDDDIDDVEYEQETLPHFSTRLTSKHSCYQTPTSQQQQQTQQFQNSTITTLAPNNSGSNPPDDVSSNPVMSPLIVSRSSYHVSNRFQQIADKVLAYFGPQITPACLLNSSSTISTQTTSSSTISFSQPKQIIAPSHIPLYLNPTPCAELSSSSKSKCVTIARVHNPLSLLHSVSARSRSPFLDHLSAFALYQPILPVMNFYKGLLYKLQLFIALFKRGLEAELLIHRYHLIVDGVLSFRTSSEVAFQFIDKNFEQSICENALKEYERRVQQTQQRAEQQKSQNISQNEPRLPSLLLFSSPSSLTDSQPFSQTQLSHSSSVSSTSMPPIDRSSDDNLHCHNATFYHWHDPNPIISDVAKLIQHPVISRPSSQPTPRSTRNSLEFFNEMKKFGPTIQTIRSQRQTSFSSTSILLQNRTHSLLSPPQTRLIPSGLTSPHLIATKPVLALASSTNESSGQLDKPRLSESHPSSVDIVKLFSSDKSFPTPTYCIPALFDQNIYSTSRSILFTPTIRIISTPHAMPNSFLSPSIYYPSSLHHVTIQEKCMEAIRVEPARISTQFLSQPQIYLRLYQYCALRRHYLQIEPVLNQKLHHFYHNVEQLYTYILHHVIYPTLLPYFLSHYEQIAVRTSSYSQLPNSFHSDFAHDKRDKLQFPIECPLLRTILSLGSQLPLDSDAKVCNMLYHAQNIHVMIRLGFPLPIAKPKTSPANHSSMENNPVTTSQASVQFPYNTLSVDHTVDIQIPAAVSGSNISTDPTQTPTGDIHTSTPVPEIAVDTKIPPIDQISTSDIELLTTSAPIEIASNAAEIGQDSFNLDSISQTPTDFLTMTDSPPLSNIQDISQFSLANSPPNLVQNSLKYSSVAVGTLLDEHRLLMDTFPPVRKSDVSASLGENCSSNNYADLLLQRTPSGTSFYSNICTASRIAQIVNDGFTQLILPPLLHPLPYLPKPSPQLPPSPESVPDFTLALYQHFRPTPQLETSWSNASSLNGGDESFFTPHTTTDSITAIPLNSNNRSSSNTLPRLPIPISNPIPPPAAAPSASNSNSSFQSFQSTQSFPQPTFSIASFPSQLQLANNNFQSPALCDIQTLPSLIPLQESPPRAHTHLDQRPTHFKKIRPDQRLIPHFEKIATDYHPGPKPTFSSTNNALRIGLDSSHSSFPINIAVNPSFIFEATQTPISNSSSPQVNNTSTPSLSPPVP